jgi:hypothetical protein
MTIQDMGALGDLIGGDAVLVRLVYLAIQIRQNSKAYASLIRQNFYDATQQQILHAVESWEFNELIYRGWWAIHDHSHAAMECSCFGVYDSATTRKYFGHTNRMSDHH